MFSFKEVTEDNQSELIIPLVEMLDDYYLEQTKYNYTADRKYIHSLLISTLDETTYCVIFKNNIPIGFFRFSVDNQEGLVEEFMYVEYLYIKPEYRNTTVIGFVYATVVEIQEMLNVSYIYADIIVTPSSSNNISKIADTKILAWNVVLNTLEDKFLTALRKRYYKKEDNV